MGQLISLRDNTAIIEFFLISRGYWSLNPSLIPPQIEMNALWLLPRPRHANTDFLSFYGKWAERKMVSWLWSMSTLVCWLGIHGICMALTTVTRTSLMGFVAERNGSPSDSNAPLDAAMGNKRSSCPSASFLFVYPLSPVRDRYSRSLSADKRWSMSCWYRTFRHHVFPFDIPTRFPFPRCTGMSPSSDVLLTAGVKTVSGWANCCCWLTLGHNSSYKEAEQWRYVDFLCVVAPSLYCELRFPLFVDQITADLDIWAVKAMW